MLVTVMAISPGANAGAQAGSDGNQPEVGGGMIRELTHAASANDRHGEEGSEANVLPGDDTAGGTGGAVSSTEEQAQHDQVIDVGDGE